MRFSQPDQEKMKLEYYRKNFTDMTFDGEELLDFQKDALRMQLIRAIGNSPRALDVEKFFENAKEIGKYYLEKNGKDVPQLIQACVDKEKLGDAVARSERFISLSNYSIDALKNPYVAVKDGPYWDEIFKEMESKDPDKEDADYEK